MKIIEQLTMKYQISNLKYIINPEESLIIENIAKFISPENKSGNYNDDWFDRNIFNVLINRIGDEELNSNYVNNKYLYFFTGGAICYLKGIYSMWDEILEIDKREKDAIKTIITRLKIPVPDFDVVSFGPGDGRKEIHILESYYKNYTFQYFPIDISSHLLDLTISRFITSEHLKHGEIRAINCDFFKLDNNIKDLIENKERRKIFILLGGTIGNYREKSLFEKLSSIMNDGDLLFIGFELFKKLDDLKDLILKYRTKGNLDFVTNPFKLIPMYKGHIDIGGKFFDFYTAEFEENKLVTDVDGAKAFIPKFRIPGKELEVFVAWSTKYPEENLKHFLKHLNNFKYIYTVTSEKSMVALLEKKNETLDEVKSNCLLIIKKVIKGNIKKDILKALKDLNKDIQESDNFSYLSDVYELLKVDEAVSIGTIEKIKKL